MKSPEKREAMFPAWCIPVLSLWHKCGPGELDGIADSVRVRSAGESSVELTACDGFNVIQITAPGFCRHPEGMFVFEIADGGFVDACTDPPPVRLWAEGEIEIPSPDWMRPGKVFMVCNEVDIGALVTARATHDSFDESDPQGIGAARIGLRSDSPMLKWDGRLIPDNPSVPRCVRHVAGRSLELVGKTTDLLPSRGLQMGETTTASAGTTGAEVNAHWWKWNMSEHYRDAVVLAATMFCAPPYLEQMKAGQEEVGEGDGS